MLRNKGRKKMRERSHFAAADQHFTAMKLFWYSGQVIMKCLPMRSEEHTSELQSQR